MEIWNRKYDGWAPNRFAVEMARRERLGEFVSLDFHTRRQFFPLAMALRVDGDASPDPGAVYSALRAGASSAARSAVRRCNSPRAIV